MKPQRPCTTPGCPNLTQGGPCPEHAKKRERDRGSAAERGYDARWQRYRKWFLAQPENALCRICLQSGTVTASTVVDHIKPHKGDYELFWDPTDHQGTCKPCHDSKTAREDGGFGRETKS
ncbi:MAG TPA: HNH endonuclease signature motif containing protein [Symbiobacteriaceae bacterium]